MTLHGTLVAHCASGCVVCVCLRARLACIAFTHSLLAWLACVSAACPSTSGVESFNLSLKALAARWLHLAVNSIDVSTQ